MEKYLIATVFIYFVAALIGCSRNEDSVENSKETVTSDQMKPDEQKASYWKQVDESYYTPAAQQGHLERLVYQTDGRENAAIVYVPYGYDSENVETRYNILYLQHGGGGDETVYMGDTDSPNELKNMVDHMIENGEISPMLIVMPMLETEGGYSKAVMYARAFPKELMNDLMPEAESKYHTYATEVSDEGFRNSRSHRAFGGFSMGSVTTWAVFSQSLDYIRYFMPMSGDSFDVVDLNAELLDEEFFIFAAKFIPVFLSTPKASCIL